MSKIQAIIYAMSFLGSPYEYGANGPNAFDCRGLALEVMKSVGVFSYAYNDTADGIYHKMQDPLFGKKIDKAEAGALVFFGKPGEKIDHVAIVIDENRMIEAGGGFPGMTDLERNLHSAFVRIRPIRMRTDFRAFFMPRYPFQGTDISYWVDLFSPSAPLPIPRV